MNQFSSVGTDGEKAGAVRVVVPPSWHSKSLDECDNCDSRGNMSRQFSVLNIFDINKHFDFRKSAD